MQYCHAFVDGRFLASSDPRNVSIRVVHDTVTGIEERVSGSIDCAGVDPGLFTDEDGRPVEVAFELWSPLANGTWEVQEIPQAYLNWTGERVEFTGPELSKSNHESGPGPEASDWRQSGSSMDGMYEARLDEDGDLDRLQPVSDDESE